jgi:uncharacterized protein YbjT (DUF2867 family)
MILVTGDTGHVGRAVVSRLASLGHDVVAMVRDVQAAPISRDVVAAVAAVAAKPNKSRITYMITEHRALDVGEIAEDRYSQVSKDFAAITGREPESFRDFLLRATSSRPADCMEGPPFRERHRS